MCGKDIYRSKNPLYHGLQTCNKDNWFSEYLHGHNIMHTFSVPVCKETAKYGFKKCQLF